MFEGPVQSRMAHRADVSVTVKGKDHTPNLITMRPQDRAQQGSRPVRVEFRPCYLRPPSWSPG